MIRTKKNQDKRQKQPLVKFGKRLKKRHYLIEFIFTNEKQEELFQRVDSETIHRCIAEHFIKYWGIMGRTLLYQRPSFRITYFNARTHMCILQIPRDVQDMFSGCLPFLKSIDHRVECFVRVLHISGTIRALKTVAIQYHHQWMRDAHVTQLNTPKVEEFGGDFISFGDDDELMDDGDQVVADKNTVDSMTKILTISNFEMKEE
jgi:RNase P/RNase MRP subunit POP5